MAQKPGKTLDTLLEETKSTFGELGRRQLSSPGLKKYGTGAAVGGAVGFGTAYAVTSIPYVGWLIGLGALGMALPLGAAAGAVGGAYIIYKKYGGSRRAPES